MALNLNDSQKPQDDDTEMVELFNLDDVAYSIPMKPKVNLALKYLHMARTQGPDIAAGFLLEELLGADAYTALMNYDDLTPEQLETVMNVAQQVTLGELEVAKNPLGSGSKKLSPGKRAARR